MAASTPGQHLPGVRPSKALSSFTALSVRFGLSPIPPKPLRGSGDEDGDPLGSQEQQHIHRPILRNSSSARPPRAADASLRPRTAILRIALLALGPNSSPKLVPMLSPTRQENRLRFSRLKNKHSPKLAPVLRPVSASLRLRLRSAAFLRRPLGFHLYFAHRKMSEIPL